jgi:hypothetical protein
LRNPFAFVAGNGDGLHPARIKQESKGGLKARRFRNVLLPKYLAAEMTRG